ncbi:gustatory and odorant receptor 21a-like isoform X2 [Nilaparvata lugens]|nr:gustatory and odorant receptor 21a-like isoform X2 [Nilaparvata lugens]XP_039281368.1 gustatory and odorant receptor 21a-like isoform X2 [Nilaparvata lugens]
MAASSSQTIQSSFNIIGYFLLLLGIYPFHYKSAKRTKLYRILQMIYCSIVTIIHSIVILLLTYSAFLYFILYLQLHNVNMVAYYISSVITMKACLVQRALYYWKAADIYDHLNDWRNFEIEYKSFTGKKLNAVSYKKTLIVAILSPLVIVYVTIMSFLGENSNGPPPSVLVAFLTIVFFSVIQLMRLYTELMWYLFSNALKNAALQLADDYKSDPCQESGLDRANYEYLWIKLAQLQNRLPKTLSKIYGYQLAVNFLQLLFYGFVFFEFIFRYMTIDILLKTLRNPHERYHFIYLMSGLYGQTTICFVYLWLGSVTAGAAQKALLENTKKKLLEILSDSAKITAVLHQQAKRFLQKVSATKTQITFSGYGRIDRQFFCTILITWINYMIILLQFKTSFYEEDKDETIKETSRNKRSIPNADSTEFQSNHSFFSFDNMGMNRSTSLPFIHGWFALSTIYKLE